MLNVIISKCLIVHSNSVFNPDANQKGILFYSAVDEIRTNSASYGASESSEFANLGQCSQQFSKVLMLAIRGDFDALKSEFSTLFRILVFFAM